MNDKVEKLRSELKEHLESVKARLDSAKDQLESAAQETSDSIDAKKEDIKAQLSEQKQKLAAARQQADEWVEAKKAETGEKIEAWTQNREIEKLEKRADRAEDNAAAAIVIAAYAADDAECAILEAIGARLLAEDART